MTLVEILNLVTIGVATIAYIWTFKYQANKITALEKQITSQSTIISDFDKYKSIFDVEDFEKRLKLKLDSQKDELNIQFKKQMSISIDEALKITAQRFQAEHLDILNAWNELQQITINITLNQFPKKEQKIERDNFILKHYPRNAEYLIRFIDDIQDGKITPEKS